MAVTSCIVFRADDGSTWPTEEEAKQRNGVLALRAHLRKTYGEEYQLNEVDVLQHFSSWYLVYLEGCK